MKLLPNKSDTDLIDYNKLEQIVNMVADRTMERSDLKFGPVQVKVYAAGTVLRIDIQTDE
ncbi:MAG TPA: hypothetical protein VGE97_06535 [Nitrososphaera sp.]|jgi:hypothetical protein